MAETTLPKCTRDPNTCQVAFCNWNRCLDEPIAIPLPDRITNESLEKGNQVVESLGLFSMDDDEHSKLETYWKFVEWTHSDECHFIFSEQDVRWYKYEDHFEMSTSDLYKFYNRNIKTINHE